MLVIRRREPGKGCFLLLSKQSPALCVETMPPVNLLEHGMERNLLQRATTASREIGFFRVLWSLSRQRRCWLDAILVYVDASSTGYSGFASSMRDTRTRYATGQLCYSYVQPLHEGVERTILELWDSAGYVSRLRWRYSNELYALFPRTMEFDPSFVCLGQGILLR